MRQILRPDGYATVADGTKVGALLNAARGPTIDGDLSLAVGHLVAGIHSAVHFHPVVTQLCYVLAGSLDVWMREPGDEQPYCLSATTGDCVVTQPGTLLQLRNDHPLSASVLYVVTPGYLQEKNASGNIVFDDAVIAGPSWNALTTTQLAPPAERAFTQHRADVRSKLSHAP